MRLSSVCFDLFGEGSKELIYRRNRRALQMPDG